MSPFWIRCPSSRSSSAVTRGRREISLRYFLRDSEPELRTSSRSCSIRLPTRSGSIARGRSGSGVRSADRHADDAVLGRSAERDSIDSTPCAGLRLDPARIRARRAAGSGARTGRTSARRGGTSARRSRARSRADPDHELRRPRCADRSSADRPPASSTCTTNRSPAARTTSATGTQASSRARRRSPCVRGRDSNSSFSRLRTVEISLQRIPAGIAAQVPPSGRLDVDDLGVDDVPSPEAGPEPPDPDSPSGAGCAR